MRKAARRKKIPNSQVQDIHVIFLVGLSLYLVVAFFTPWGGVVGKTFCKLLTQWFGVSSYLVILFPLMTVVFLQDPSRKPSWLHLTYLLSWFLSISFFFDLLNMGGASAFLIWPVMKLVGEGGALVLAWTLLTLTTILVINVSLKNLLLKCAAVFGWVMLPFVKSASAIFFIFKLLAKALLGIAALLRRTTRKQKLTLPENMEITEPSILTKIPELPPLCAPMPLDEPIIQDEEEEEPEPVLPNKKKKQEDLKGYTLPSLDLLENAEPKREKSARIEPSDYSRLLEETLRSFGIEASVLHVERGPTVTRYELQPAKGVKVSKIVALSDDLALALAAMSLRIEAPIPGKSAIGIEIPNSSVAMVYFKDLLATSFYQESSLKMILALGKDITGKPIFTEMKRMPHLLIAGATGSGKTVCINTLIASILFKATPLEVQFVMIDPKRVELTIYDGIPHLIREVVTDPKEAAKVLVDVLSIMDERYNFFKEARVRNLDEYNKARPESPLPYIIVLIDELADLMMLAAAAVESSIARLTALARAAGIHLIVATQRPSVDVITGIIKANIPSRIAFAVSSIADSRTILDTGGSEKLLGRGDMLFAPIDAMKPIRLQGAYVSLSEIEELVNFWSQQPSPENLVRFPVSSDDDAREEFREDGDELYSQAKEVILRTGQASVSTLQRKLKIGYARAGRIMDLMEQRGIVGPADGAKPRKILISNPFRPG